MPTQNTQGVEHASQKTDRLKTFDAPLKKKFHKFQKKLSSYLNPGPNHD